MCSLKIFILLLAIIHCAVSQLVATTNVAETATLVEDYPALTNAPNNLESLSEEASQKSDYNGERYARHIGGGVIGGGGVVGGVGVIGGGGYAAPVYAAPAVPVVSAVPVVTTVPVVTAVPSYPVYGGYGGYGGGFGGYGGGIGAGFGVAKFRVKGFGIGGGFLG